jgi:hypothetical protein
MLESRSEQIKKLIKYVMKHLIDQFEEAEEFLMN